MRWQFSILLALAVSTRTAAQTAQRADLPMNAAPVFKPCTDQPRTTKAFIASYSRGRAPTRADLMGAWVAIGIGYGPPSRPDLNCAGLVRGTSGVFESVIVPQRDSVEVDMIGMGLYRIPLSFDAHGDLLLPIEEGGDYAVDYKCRVTDRRTLACLTATARAIIFGTEYRRMPVRGSQRMNLHVDVP